MSIGLPTFNHAEFLPGALDTVLGQSFGDFELNVSDNASTDDTWEILQKYAGVDSRIRLIRQRTNIGMIPNWNTVRDMSCGEFFMWVGDDDLYDLDYVLILLETLRNVPSAILAYSYVRLFGPVLRREYLIPSQEFLGEIGRLPGLPRQPHCVYVRRLLLLRGAGIPIMGLFRSDALPRTPLPEFRVLDTLFMPIMALRGTFVFVPKVLLQKYVPGVEDIVDRRRDPIPSSPRDERTWRRRLRHLRRSAACLSTFLPELIRSPLLTLREKVEVLPTAIWAYLPAQVRRHLSLTFNGPVVSRWE